MAKKKDKLVIHLEGGCIRAVYGKKKMDVEIMDSDNAETNASFYDETEPLKEFEKELKLAVKGLKEIY